MLLIYSYIVHLFTNEYQISPYSGADTGTCVVCDQERGKCSRAKGFEKIIIFIKMIAGKKPGEGE